MIKQKNIILLILGIFAVYQYFYTDTVIFLICVVSVGFMYWLSNKDILTRTIPAILVYVAMGVIFLLRFCYICKNTVETVPVYVSKSIIVFLIFYILSKILWGKIGNGDFDIAYIIYLSIGLEGLFYTFIIACVLSLIVNTRKMLNDRKNIKTFSVPFIPYMYIGYVTVLLFWKEMIAI